MHRRTQSNSRVPRKIVQRYNTAKKAKTKEKFPGEAGRKRTTGGKGGEGRSNLGRRRRGDCVCQRILSIEGE